MGQRYRAPVAEASGERLEPKRSERTLAALFGIGCLALLAVRCFRLYPVVLLVSVVAELSHPGLRNLLSQPRLDLKSDSIVIFPEQRESQTRRV